LRAKPSIYSQNKQLNENEREMLDLITKKDKNLEVLQNPFTAIKNFLAKKVESLL
jgi:phosphopantothenate synthetase